MAKTAKQILKERDEGRGARTNFDSYWQTLHDYFDNVGMDVNTSYYPGTELTVNQLYSSFTLETADVLESGLFNYLTPRTSKWFGLRTGNLALMEKKKVLHYLKDVEAEVQHALNTSNFYDVMPEFYRGSGVYGTSVVFEEDDPFDMVRFYSIPIKRLVINEDARGRVVEYYIEFEYTATQAVTRFGPEKVHDKILEEFKKGRHPDKKFMYTLYIGPNWERNPQAMNTENKPYIAQWIDDKHQYEVDKGGFDEMPAFAHRFYKRDSIAWGFSPAMKALSSARVFHAKEKTLLRGEMKATDPAMAMPDNAFITPFNGNPRGVNYYQNGSLTQQDIFPVGNYGNPAVGMESIERAERQVKQMMFTDVFRAFDSITKQMNNPEVYERISEKMTLLGPAVGRFIRVTDDVINRTMSILDRKGRLPEPPEEVLERSEDGAAFLNYEVDYVSKLALAQRNPELQAMQNALLMAGNMAQFSPDVIDKIDPDKGIDQVWNITGAPVQMLRDDEAVQDIRDRRAQAEAAAQEAQMMAMGADIAVKGTQAGKNVAETQAL